MRRSRSRRGVNLAYKFKRETFGYFGLLQALHRACVSAAHASFAGDLREKLVVPPGTSSRGAVARSYITGRFQKGVIDRGVDIASDPEDTLGNNSAE